MKTEIMRSLTETFEGHAQQTDGGVEYWLARDVQHLLGYTKWENFLNVVSKAKTACRRTAIFAASSRGANDQFRPAAAGSIRASKARA